MVRNQPRRNRFLFLGALLLLGALLALLIVAIKQETVLTEWRFALGDLFSDAEGLRTLVNQIGWLGPPALIGLNILQIVVAPIPAYGLYVVAGILYGPFWGGLYSSIGTLAGGALAMTLVRRFGSPVAQRLMGEERLDKWQKLAIGQSPFLWGAILLAPVGDIPFFLAGLTPVRIPTILALTILTRIPTVFLISAAASGAKGLDGTDLALLVAAALLVLMLLIRRRQEILDRSARILDRIAHASSRSGMENAESSE